MAATLRGLIVAMVLAGCERSLPDHDPVTGGNPKHGRQLIQHFGCGSCHKISGVPGANATVAPPLEKLRSRVYLAGRFANTPDNLVQWIRDPRAMDSQTAMPAVGVDEAQARDIAAYLYTR